MWTWRKRKARLLAFISLAFLLWFPFVLGGFQSQENPDQYEKGQEGESEANDRGFGTQNPLQIGQFLISNLIKLI